MDYASLRITASQPTAQELEQMERLVRTTPVAWLLSTLGAVICYVQFADGAAGQALDLWMIGFCVLTTARMVAGWIILPRGARVPPSHAWLRGWLATTLLHAAHWGLLSLVLHVPGSPEAESILHITLVAIAMGGSVRLPGFPKVMLAHVALVLAPVVVRDLWLASTYSALMALLVFLIAVYALVSGRNQSRALKEIDAQRARNDQLIAALQRENERSEAARLAAEQAGAARTRFFAAANHDLRQPLHAMGLLSQTLIERRGEVDVDDVARHLGDCVDGMALVIDDLLDITRLDTGHLSPQWSSFPLDSLVLECCRPHEPLARAKGLQLAVEVAPLMVHSDRAMLARVLSNLLSNAIRYTPDGSVRVQAMAGDASVRLTVHDTGIGIDPHDMPHIFEEFYQAGNPARDRRLGLGLGLATVKRLGDLLSLNLAVESSPGQGSRFSLTLPLSIAAAPVRAHPPGDVQAGALFTGRRVLVIEDDADSRAALAGLLASWGCDVRQASGSGDMPSDLREGIRIDALVVDLRLADGASGIDVVRELRDVLGRDTPALIVTGDAGSAHMQRAIDAGLTVLVKPVRPVRLRAFLAQAFADGHVSSH